MDSSVMRAIAYVDKRLEETQAKIEDLQRELRWLHEERRKILDEAQAQAKKGT